MITSNKPIWITNNYANWWATLWYPAKTAALEAEKEYNLAVIEANKYSDDQELTGSLSLTKMQNQMIIIIAIIILFVIMVIKKGKK